MPAERRSSIVLFLLGESPNPGFIIGASHSAVRDHRSYSKGYVFPHCFQLIANHRQELPDPGVVPENQRKLRGKEQLTRSEITLIKNIPETSKWCLSLNGGLLHSHFSWNNFFVETHPEENSFSCWGASKILAYLD